mgnify:CR=1 FL=1
MFQCDKCWTAFEDQPRADRCCSACYYCGYTNHSANERLERNCCPCKCDEHGGGPDGTCIELGLMTSDLYSYLKTDLQAKQLFWEQNKRKQCLMNRDGPKTKKPTLVDVLRETEPWELIECILPETGETIRMWSSDDGFEWDSWGSYRDTEREAQRLGGIAFTIHDGDDGIAEYLRVPMGRVNRFGAHVMTPSSQRRLLEYANLPKEINNYDTGQVLIQSTDPISLTVQGGELSNSRDD